MSAIGGVLDSEGRGIWYDGKLCNLVDGKLVERTKDMGQKKKTVAEQLLDAARRSPALEAAYIALMAEARRTLQAVKVAALTHAAAQFTAIAEAVERAEFSKPEKPEAGALVDVENYRSSARRCADEARVQLGQVTG